MRRALTWLAVLFALAFLGAPLRAQQVVDRIVARVEGDIITLSEVRELGGYQQLVQGRAESDDRLLAELIAQWIVDAEATAARFPRPMEAEVNREIERAEKQFASPEAYRQRLGEIGLSVAAVRRLVGRQLYLARYLDYKFRPALQVDSAAMEKYYAEEFVPALKARGKAVPPLESLQDQIRELLIERGISQRAARWLDETRSRIKVEIEPAGKRP